MFCKKCPHHVRHGKVAEDKKSIEFSNRCGLRMKLGQSDDCDKYPFISGFNYVECDTYKHVFKSTGQRNDCIPTSDFLYSDNMSGTPITEMELL
jgi:hypothetical protein